MSDLVLNEKFVEEQRREFLEGKEEPFSYGLDWTDEWTNKKITGGKSFRELLVWEGHSLWHFFEYFIRDASPIPFPSFAEILLKIDLYDRILKKHGEFKTIVVDGLGELDAKIIDNLAKRSGTKLTIRSISHRRNDISYNRFLIKNGIKFRILLRYLISKTRGKESTHKDLLILTNDRHMDSRGEDTFFGPVIHELENERLAYKLVEYDRPYSPDNIKNTLGRHAFKRAKLGFIGDYYDLKTLSRIIGAAKQIRDLGKSIICHEDFSKTLNYKGVDIYPLVKDRIEYAFDVLSYYISDVIVTTMKILETEQPKVVLLEHEKNFYDKGIIVNANKWNSSHRTPIKTVCFEGEVVYDKNSYLRSVKTQDMNNKKSPLWRPLPDAKLLWGAYSEKWYLKNSNYPPEILQIVGAPKYDFLVGGPKPFDRESVLKRYRLDDKRTALVITGKLPWEEKLIFESLSALKDHVTQIIVKLHPDDSPKIKNMIYAYGSKLGIPNLVVVKYVNFFELLAISDIVLTYESTLGYDVLVANKPMVVINFSGLDCRLPYATKRIVRVVTNPKDLADAVKRALDGKQDIKKRDIFMKHVLHLQDGNASYRAVDIIKRMLGR